MSVRRKGKNWYVQYRIPGRKSPIKEYFGPGPGGKNAAEIRQAEIAYLKAKGEPPRHLGSIHLDQLAQIYLDDAKVRGCSKKWLAEFANLLNKYILPHLSNRPAAKIEYADILNMATQWSGKSTATVNRYLSYLRAVFRFGVSQGLLDKNPMAKWKNAKEYKRDIKLTIEDLRRLMRHAAPHLAWAIEVEWALGLRPGGSELFALQWSDVDFDAGTIHVRGTKTASSNRIVPVSQEFKGRLLEMRERAQSSFIVEYSGRPVKALRTSLKRAAQRAGLTYAVRLYDIRHLFASTKLAGGADLAAVSRMLGHADISTTQRHYYHLLKGEMERAAEIGPSLHEKAKKGKVVKLR